MANNKADKSTSIYDTLKTPKELVTYVMAHGLSTAVNDICRVQDIFGRAPIADLVELANDDNQAANKAGRTHSYQSTFYMVLFHIWNWEDATRFYNQHTNPEPKAWMAATTAAKAEAQQATSALKDLQKKHDKLWEDINTLGKAKLEQEQRAGRAETQLAAAQQTILELKAKLYDLTMNK